MKIFYLGTGCFFVAFFLQWLLWKIHLPKRQAKTLLQIFFGTWFVAIGFLVYLSAKSSIGLSSNSPSVIFHSSLLFFALLSSYLNTYPGLEADSPSLLIVMTIHNAGPKGVPVQEFVQKLNDDLLVRPRIYDLLKDHMVELKDGRYRLMPKGKLMAQVFVLYRNLLGAQKGG